MTTQTAQTTAQRLADELNAYKGDNFWQDVVESYGLDREAIEAADPCGMSTTIILDNGGEVRYMEDRKTWLVVFTDYSEREPTFDDIDRFPEGVYSASKLNPPSGAECTYIKVRGNGRLSWCDENGNYDDFDFSIASLRDPNA